MGVAGVRELYNRLEELATPAANDLTRSGEFARTVAFVTSVNKTLRRAADRLAARAWHAVNLPTRTDVQRLRTQLGSLDREVRLLSLELQRQRREVKPRGVSRTEHDGAGPS